MVYDPEYMTGLPERSSNLVDCNFIIRMLYLNAYWLNNGLFMLLVCYVLLYVVALCVKMRYAILCIKRLFILQNFDLVVWPGCLCTVDHILLALTVLCKQMSAEGDSYTCFYVASCWNNSEFKLTVYSVYCDVMQIQTRIHTVPMYNAKIECHCFH